MDSGMHTHRAMAAQMKEIARGLVKDELVVLDMPEVAGWTKPYPGAILALLRAHEAAIKATFTQNEYLKLDVTHGEMLGLHSTSNLGDTIMPDLPVMNHVIRENPKYKEATIWNIGNIEIIYK